MRGDQFHHIWSPGLFDLRAPLAGSMTAEFRGLQTIVEASEPELQQSRPTTTHCLTLTSISMLKSRSRTHAFLEVLSGCNDQLARAAMQVVSPPLTVSSKDDVTRAGSTSFS